MEKVPEASAGRWEVCVLVRCAFSRKFIRKKDDGRRVSSLTGGRGFV
jgi:hypothetical protein